MSKNTQEATADAPHEAAWRRQATEMFAAGASEDEVQLALRKAGCLAYLRREICEQARRAMPVDRGHHRRVGLRAFVFGLAMCALGVGLWASLAALPRGQAGVPYVTGGRYVALAGIACVVVGFTPMVFGFWKLLTGSAAAVVAPRR